MDEQDLIYDWNEIDYEIKRDESRHPHELWSVSYTHLTLPTKA